MKSTKKCHSIFEIILVGMKNSRHKKVNLFLHKNVNYKQRNPNFAKHIFLRKEK